MTISIAYAKDFYSKSDANFSPCLRRASDSSRLPTFS
jgi:hypothetical protein